MATSAHAKDTNWDVHRKPHHAVIGVLDVQKHVDYYKKHFGMQLLNDSDGGKSRLMGYSASSFALKITQVSDATSFDIGTGFGHFGIVMRDVYAAVDQIKSSGGRVTREAGPVKGGNTIIAFVEDPSGYKWELLQRPESPEPLCQVMLRVNDLAASVKFYENLGMTKIRERDAPEQKYTLGFFGYGPEETSAVMELTYNYGKTDYTLGSQAYSHVSISTSDIKRAAAEMGGKIESEGEDGTGSFTLFDPDGWKVTFVGS